MRQGVNLTRIIRVPPDGHNPLSLLDMNQGLEWKLSYYKHWISANAQVHTVNVNTPFIFPVENRLPFIIENSVLKCNGLLSKSLKSVTHLPFPL